MRKAQKKEIQECLLSLKQAHEEIRNVLRKKEADPISFRQRMQSVLKMFCECQEFAVFIGETIERFEGQGHATVSFLEEYCELLFRIYEEISTGATESSIAAGNIPSLDEDRIFDVLGRQLDEIENSVRNDVSIRKEIVFLPYKAAMWDSMESVWMATEREENCDIYVVPIPYYEREPGGALGQMYYEGREYPDYVPVTDWQTYSLEEHRPDMVYIQNPYDDWNYVTCVHPQFFSRELKKYTDRLIYLPYFVGIDDYVSEHFCTAPGVANADRVIVQSEKVKKLYIRNIRKFEKENKCKGLFGDLDRKFLVQESPKLDRIKRVLESGEVSIPEEWKAKLIRADGRRKKVILYNTTIDTLLKHSDIYMSKLRSVLDTFRREPDVALLWRPHPLLIPTIKSMRPDLYQEYMEIVGKFREEGWGIYDETPDIDRAIVLSDAYYGDMSSVVEMYKVTGRPIMIQNCEI